MNTFKLGILILLLIQLPCNGFQQITTEYAGLKSQGKIPEDFLISSEEKFKTDYSDNKEDTDKNFYLNSRFAIDEILKSGRIVFNDPISVYIHDVAKLILKDNSELYGKLRFYTIKSNIPNAFSTDQGIIFVTTGLVARLNCEAELAFILAHEISHYLENHVKEGYEYEQNQGDDLNRLSNVKKNDIIRNLSVYSQNNELEADSLGLLIFAKSNYDFVSAQDALWIASQENACFENYEFPTNFFDLESVKLPTYLTDREICIFGSEKKSSQSLVTHPELEVRLYEIELLASKMQFEGKSNFILPEARFYEIQELARSESILLHLKERKYVEAIYEINFMKQDKIWNSFLAVSKLKAYYGLLKYMNLAPTRYFNEIVTFSESQEDNSNFLKCFFKRINSEHLNVIAIRQAFETYLEFPSEPEIQFYKDEIFKSVMFDANLALNEFRTDSYTEYLKEARAKSKAANELLNDNKIPVTSPLPFLIKPTNQTKDSIVFNEKNKIGYPPGGYIGTSKETKNAPFIPSNPENKFHLFYLSDLILNHQLLEEFDNLAKKDTLQIIEKTTIEKILVVDPIYQNYKLNSNKRLVKSERTSVKLEPYYVDKYKKIDMEVEVLSSNSQDENSVDDFNHLAELKLWFYELALHDSLNLIPSNQHKIDSISNYYEVDHILFTGVFAYRDRHKINNLHALLLASIWGTPIAIADLLIVHNNFLQVSILLNSQRSEVIYTEITDVNLRGTTRSIHFFIYEHLRKINDINNN